MLIKKIAYLTLWSLLTLSSVIVANSNLVSGNDQKLSSTTEQNELLTISNDIPFSSHAIANKENELINSYQSNLRKPTLLFFSTYNFFTVSKFKYTALTNYFFSRIPLVKTPIILQIRNLRI